MGVFTDNKITLLIENASVARYIFKLLKVSYNININLTHLCRKTVGANVCRSPHFAGLRKTLCQGTQTSNRGIAQGKRKTLLLSTLGVFDKGGCLNEQQHN